MITSRSAEMQAAEPMPTTLGQSKRGTRWYWIVSWLLGRKAVNEAVATRVHFSASPDVVWNHIMFYEEVPGRPPFLLCTLMPHPVRTEGDKTRVGAMVRCAYSEGDLMKRITRVEPPHSLKFEVINQRLGIESCVLTLGGSFQIYTCGNATDVVLTTNYQAYLHPRYLWRPLEALLVRQLHGHIVRGVRAAVLLGEPASRPVAAETLTVRRVPTGDLTCSVSQSRSRH
jgi:hypothetical protein